MSKHDPLALYHAVMGEAWAEEDRKAKGGRDRAGERQARSFKRAGEPSVRNIIKAATGSRAAVFKRIRNGGCKTVRSLGSQLDYVNDKAAFTYSNQINSLDGDDTLSEQQKADLIAQWAGTWRGTSKLGFTSHMLLSFPKDVNAEQVKGIALEWCEHFFESGHYGDKWDYVISVHTDRDHPHAHILLNNRGSVMGEWFACWAGGNMSPQLMREKQAEIAEGYGISLNATTRLERGLTNKPANLAEIYAAKAEGREPVEAALTEDESEAVHEVIMGFVEDYQNISAILDSDNKATLANAVRSMQHALSNGEEWTATQGDFNMAEIKTVGDAIEYAETQIDGLRGRAAELSGVERAAFEVEAAPLLADFYKLVPDPDRRAAFNQELVDVYPPGADVSDLADRFLGAAERENLAAVIQDGQELGLNTDEILARMEAGGTKNHGLAQEWVERDMTAILGKEGIALENATDEEFDLALEKLDGFQRRLTSELGIEMESPFDLMEARPQLTDEENERAFKQSEAEWLAGESDYLGRMAEEGFERQQDQNNDDIRQLAQELRDGTLTEEQKFAIEESFLSKLQQSLTAFEMEVLRNGNWEVLNEAFDSPVDQIDIAIEYMEILMEGRADAEALEILGDLHKDRARVLAGAMELTEEGTGDEATDMATAHNGYIRQLAHELREGSLTDEQESTLQRALVSELHQELGDEGMAELDRGNWEVLDEVLPSKVDQIGVTQKYLEVAAEERGDADLADLASSLHQERARARAAELTEEQGNDRGLDDDMSM